MSKKMNQHFSKVAPVYKRVRTTDIEPVLCIKEKLKNLYLIRAADIGCGAGRYDLFLLQHLKNLFLTCVDSNEAMLRETSKYLKKNKISGFETRLAAAEKFPLAKSSLDCVLTFNAVHHFDFHGFMHEAGRVLKKGGLLFIYTRLRGQNARNIWGRYFPFFFEKENRLYTLGKMKKEINSAPLFAMEAIRLFGYERKATLKELIKKVESRHYSTFFLYSEAELKKYLREFKKGIERDFDANRVEWFDENVLFAIRKEGR